MTTVRDLYNALFAFAPASMKYDWDNVGLLCGHFDAPVDTVLVALDPMPDVIDEAKARGAQCIVTHHPLIFEAPRAINDESYTGRCILALAEAHIAAINLHTNLDVCPGGVNDVLAETLGLADVSGVRRVRKIGARLPRPPVRRRRQARAPCRRRRRQLRRRDRRSPRRGLRHARDRGSQIQSL